jgi:hypothetical protein
MGAILKLLCIIMTGLSISLCTPSPGHSQGYRLYLDFQKDKLTANIKNAPLKKVLSEIETEKDIKVDTDFIKDNSLLQRHVSLELESVSIQEGLDRILSGINYSLLFRGNKIIGVMLFGKPGKRSYRGRRPMRSSPYRRRP